MGNVNPITIFLLLFAIPFPACAAISSDTRGVMEVEGGPDDVVWVVQLSDLHFSVHRPERARDFKEIVGPTLSFIKPSLVLLTGDLTGESVLYAYLASLDINIRCCRFFF